MLDVIAPIWIIEDSDEDFEVIVWSFDTLSIKYPLVRLTRSEELLAMLTTDYDLSSLQTKFPRLILLDLNLPGLGGREILRQLKSSDLYAQVPVVVLSTSNNPRDIQACYRLGASGFICKPLGLDAFLAKIKALAQYWFEAVEMP